MSTRPFDTEDDRWTAIQARVCAATQRPELVARACRMVEASETPPSLDDLAAKVGMSPFHFLRLFKSETGFNLNSRFYEASDRLLGMLARDYPAGGAGAVVRFAVGQCSLGAILLAQSQRGICAILLGDDPDLLVRDLQDQFPKAEFVGCDGGLGGYRWGVDRKGELLRREASN